MVIDVMANPQKRVLYVKSNKDFCSAVVVFRKEKGWTQSELAMELGLKQSFISQIESGRVNPRLNSILPILHRLGVDVILSANPNQEDNKLNMQSSSVKEEIKIEPISAKALKSAAFRKLIRYKA